MAFLTDMHFLVGLVLGALIYHLWMMRKGMSAASGG